MWYNFDVVKNKTNPVHLHKIPVNNDKLDKWVNYYNKKIIITY